MLIYLDNCCFNRPYDKQLTFTVRTETEAKLIIQDMVKENQLDLAWSYILDYENSQNPFEEKRAEIKKWKNLSKTFSTETEMILKNAESFQKSGFKAFDSLHLSCAVSVNCNYFITVDKGILRKSVKLNKFIEILNPIEFISTLENMNEN